MFDTIILVTGLAEQSALASVLRSHDSRLTIRAVTSRADLEAVEPELFRRARLIGFVTPVVVPAHILDALGFGAYNFHPGPPHYPGWMPSHFAIYNGATDFGVTAHIMVERVDAGPIVGVKHFGIPLNASASDLEQLAFVQLARLFWSLAPTLATQPEPLPELPVGWSGRKSTRRLYAALCEIPPDLSEGELERRVAVFGAGHFGPNPAIPPMHAGPRGLSHNLTSP
jgi:methionyl-tRNA formyltransferase